MAGVLVELCCCLVPNTLVLGGFVVVVVLIGKCTIVSACSHRDPVGGGVGIVGNAVNV
jgi:hypothetical protein